MRQCHPPGIGMAPCKGRFCNAHGFDTITLVRELRDGRALRWISGPAYYSRNRGARRLLGIL